MSKHYPVEQRERAAKMVPITSMSIGRCMPPAGRLAQVRVGAESLRPDACRLESMPTSGRLRRVQSNSGSRILSVKSETQGSQRDSCHLPR
jgi:hypothetical protein